MSLSMKEFYIYTGEVGRKVLRMLVQSYLYNNWPGAQFEKDEEAEKEQTDSLKECRGLYFVDQELFTRKDAFPELVHKTVDRLNKVRTSNPRASTREAAEALSRDSSSEFGGFEYRVARVYDLLGPQVLDTDKTPTGAGKHWPIGERLAEAKFNEFVTRYGGERNLKVLVDHFHICHSGGGGIGCGSGPVYSTHLKKIKSEVAALTASVFLPEKCEEMGAPNTCSAIGRHFESCDGIVLFDLSCSSWTDSKGPAEPNNTIPDQFWLEDYGAGEMMLMLASSNSRVFRRATKNFEGADFAAFCKGGLGTVCSLIAPCYAEYSTVVLEDLDFKVLVKDLFNRRSFVEYSKDVSRPITRVGLFCVFPSKFQSAGIRNQLRDNWFKEILPNVVLPQSDASDNEVDDHNGENEDLATKSVVTQFHFSDDIVDRVKMLGFLVNPYMPRLFDLRDEFSRKIKAWKAQPIGTIRQDFLKDYQRGFQLYDSCLEKIYRNKEREEII
jgi:hypothetical protein